MKYNLLLAATVALISNCFADSPKIAILPLLNRGIDTTESHVISDALSNSFVHIKNIRVMERQQMNEVLKEQGFEKSGVCDSSACAINAGKILGIDQIVTGSIGKINDNYIMNLRRINVASGEVLGTASKTGNIDQFMEQPLEETAAELMGTPIENKQKAQAVNPSQLSPVARKWFIDSTIAAMQKMVDSSRVATLKNAKLMGDSLSKLYAPAAANASIATNGEAAKIGMKAYEDALRKAQEMAKNGYKSSDTTKSDK